MSSAEAMPYVVSTVCLRQYGLEDALRVASDLGFGAVDLVGLRGLCEHVPVNGSAADMRAAAAVFRRSGLRAASVNADPGSFDGFDDTGDVLRRVELLLDFAVEAEVPLLVLPAGEKTERNGSDRRIARMSDGLNVAAEKAMARDVRLAVEAPYFGRPIDRMALVGELLDGLDPAIELAFDVSHIEAADESVTDAWALLGSRVGVVHFRDAVPGDIRRVIGRGRVDFAAILEAMKASKYEGDVVLELETRNSPFASKEQEITAAVEHLEGVRRH